MDATSGSNSIVPEKEVDTLIRRWARDKNCDLNAVVVNGKTMKTLLETASAMQTFVVKTNEEQAFLACCHCLYKKFYNQVYKKQKGTKVITFGTTTSTVYAGDYTGEAAAEKKKTIEKKIIKTIGVGDGANLNVIPQKLLEYFATGFFPSGFLSKIYVFSDSYGTTYKATMKGPKGQKYLSFTKKIEEGYDYV